MLGCWSGLGDEAGNKPTEILNDSTDDFSRFLSNLVNLFQFGRAKVWETFRDRDWARVGWKGFNDTAFFQM